MTQRNRKIGCLTSTGQWDTELRLSTVMCTGNCKPTYCTSVQRHSSALRRGHARVLAQAQQKEKFLSRNCTKTSLLHRWQMTGDRHWLDNNFHDRSIDRSPFSVATSNQTRRRRSRKNARSDFCVEVAARRRWRFLSSSICGRWCACRFYKLWKRRKRQGRSIGGVAKSLFAALVYRGQLCLLSVQVGPGLFW